MEWKQSLNCIYNICDIKKNNNNSSTINSNMPIFAFDIFDTLIYSKCARFPKNESDWIWSTPNTVSIIRDLSLKYNIVLFSNLTTDKQLDMLKLLFYNLITELGVGVSIFVAWKQKISKKTADHIDNMSKPATGMFSKYIEAFGSDIPSEIHYCGDNDNIDCPIVLYRKNGSDRDFAKNINAEFHLPDLFSMEEPRSSSEQEMIILMGMPGSGKSTFAKKLSQNDKYVHCEQDDVKSQNMIKFIKSVILLKKSPIVDATNPSSENRAKFIEIAQEYNLPYRILWAARPGWIPNSFRDKPIPDIVSFSYLKKLQLPPIYERIN